MASAGDHNAEANRREAMAVLAHSATADIEALLSRIDTPSHDVLRAPECGLVMLRGRIGGDGAPFNIGEATVSRAAIRLSTGETGFGYTLGRDQTKARLIALCDALVQAADFSAAIDENVLAPLRAKIATVRAQQDAETAATRVDFFTLARGES